MIQLRPLSVKYEKRLDNNVILIIAAGKSKTHLFLPRDFLILVTATHALQDTKKKNMIGENAICIVRSFILSKGRIDRNYCNVTNPFTLDLLGNCLKLKLFDPKC